MGRPLTALRLARWLGPWASADGSPTGVESEDLTAGSTRVRWYRSSKVKPTGTIMIMPGLHYSGPDDPRFERLARVFANAGRVVAAPFLDDYIALRVTENVFVQADEAFEHVLAAPRPAPAPSLFSISFGSLPAFHVAGGAHASAAGALTIFGGYANWERAVEFALTGVDEGGSHVTSDPLNHPVVLSNLADEIPEMREHVDLLRPAWRTFCMRTWGRPEMKEPSAFAAVARELAATLPDEVAGPFLMGCGVRDGGVERARVALRTGNWSHLDPRPKMRNIRCPVHVIHGAADDVIPPSQLGEICAGLPADLRVSSYLTGLYSHTGTSGTGHSVAERARELWTMVRMLGALAT